MNARPGHPDQSVWALVPAKGLARAKSRLSPVLEPGEREQLAREMLGHVLGVLRGTSRIGRVVVVTDCDGTAREAREFGAEVLHDPIARADDKEPDRPRLGRVVDAALDTLRARGAQQALVLMGDLPWLCHADLDALLDGMEQARVALAPDGAHRGTNALGLQLAGPAQTCFGHADSFHRHTQQFAHLAQPLVQVERVGLAFDVDTPDDLARLRD